MVVCVAVWASFFLQDFHFHFLNVYYCVTLTYPSIIEVVSPNNWMIPTQCVCDLQCLLTFVTLLIFQWHCKCEFLDISYLYTGQLVIPVKGTTPVLESEFII
jgi:hypothetical protein